MTAASLEALMRNITRHRRLPFTFLTVSAVADAWQIDVRDDAGATLTMTVAGDHPIEIRTAILEYLEAAVEDGGVGHGQVVTR